MSSAIIRRQPVASLLPEIICGVTTVFVLGLIIVIAKKSFENYTFMRSHF